ncbi:LON peptidase substrate-binding domain-containing protein [Pseudomonas mangiferae]|uniref:ATP-dependent protease n=1 Tax=Pseudomonas mangiferae TaxID=2593654 RepID=A0A553GUD7_9PSED|nr:LON peptidase substrate-binding domain-containing protein [Pseudomonas mangiferae]TRX73128.1 ATP-dependent protease [Pseudomonas mangiferae]
MQLPLFPLDTVLFPGCVLDLQLFEARYLDMLGRCLKQGHGFGVVALYAGSEVGEAASDFAEVGCEALIRDWQQRPNGLLGVRVKGGRRLRVTASQVRPDRALMGDVEWLPEPADLPLDDAHDDLLALLGALGEHPMVAALGMDGAVQGQRDLANRLAYLLPFELPRKVELLALDDPRRRLQRLQALLELLQGESFG